MVEVRKPLFLLHSHHLLHLLAHDGAYDVSDRGLRLSPSGESVGTERRLPGHSPKRPARPEPPWSQRLASRRIQVAIRRWNGLSIGHSKT